MKDFKTYCDMCGKMISNGGKDACDYATLNMYPKLYDCEGTYHPEWNKDELEIDLCSTCYSMLRKDIKSRIVTKREMR